MFTAAVLAAVLGSDCTDKLAYRRLIQRLGRLDDLVVGVTLRFTPRTHHRKSKKKFSVTAYVDNNYFGNLKLIVRGGGALSAGGCITAQ